MLIQYPTQNTDEFGLTTTIWTNKGKIWCDFKALEVRQIKSKTGIITEELFEIFIRKTPEILCDYKDNLIINNTLFSAISIIPNDDLQITKILAKKIN